MHTISVRKYIILLLAVLFFGCEEPYTPEVIDAPNRFLVVSGFINAGNQPTVITLSRTQNIADNAGPQFEPNALVRVEEESGAVIAVLRAEPEGRFVSSGPLNLNASRRYRLFIRTGGKDYASEYVPVVITPPIDSVSWRVNNDVLQIYVNTHDPKNSTRYYRWEYDDTWEFTAEYYSVLEYRDGQIIDRPREYEIYRCWRSGRSTDIKIGNSTKLSQDLIKEMPLAWLPSNSDKIKYKYSLLVRQYALTREAFEYWDILKKNTENIGTLFDPLPAQLTGNVKCITTPEEPVIGFVTAGTVTEKRKFISRQELPAHWRTPASNCWTDTVMMADVTNLFNKSNNIPISEHYSEGGSLIGYLHANPFCVDCTLNGTREMPSFWE